MSNQIYENSQHKYYAQEGIVNMTSAPTTVAPSSFVDLTFAFGTNQDVNIVSLATPTRIQVLSPGIYSITGSVSSESSVTYTIQKLLLMNKQDAGTVTLTVAQDESPGIAPPATLTHSDCLSATVYLNAGDYFIVQVFCSSAVVTISSVMTIQKVY